MRTKLVLLILILSINLFSTNINIYSGQDFYTIEDTAKLFLLCGLSEYPRVDSVLISGTIILKSQMEQLRKGILAFEYPISELPIGTDSLDVVVYEADSSSKLKVGITKLEERYNAVKIDRIKGLLVTNGLPFFSAGFYTYSPVQPTLMEEEVVSGFNLISPYQKIVPETRHERIAYLDKAYDLGMKVNYNLLSVAGGGGVNLKDHDFTDLEKTLKLLDDEVKAIMNHPALLSWYISDEPYANGVKPDYLEMIYNRIKAIDPYHPIAIVFMKASQAKKYANALDIAMADPYPIPVREVYEVEKVTHRLTNEFFPKKLVWNVPQAFGGSEWWRREPTTGEMRSMLYLSLLNGASGYQFFIRKGLNGFPKSPQLWNEGSEAMLEMQQLIHWLFSGEVNPPVDDGTLSITSKGFRSGDSAIFISVNGENTPTKLKLNTPNEFTGKAEVLFENRSVDVKSGVINDYIDNYGVRIYRIYYANHPHYLPNHDERIINPSFERNFAAGIPSGCYANVGEGRGLTYFIDPRTSVTGHNSLRMHTSKDVDSFNFALYPVKVEQQVDYTLSVSARSAPKPAT
ncbi:MAG: hypothetical protein P9L91_08735, partial [Candidatus Zophobacter franzmannii]|nr:hypothetical protein [Candidatus Zophobacter franzmannii]